MMDELIKLFSEPEKANIVISTLASYVVYFYPGVISLYIINFLESHSIKNNKAFFIKIFSISYLYNLVLIYIIGYDNNKNIIYNATLIGISFITPYFWYKIKYSKFVEKVCTILKIRTCITDVALELIKDYDEEEFTYLKIYLKTKPVVYSGFLYRYEYESCKLRYIILTGYEKSIINESGEETVVLKYDVDDYREKVFIYLEDISSIEKKKCESQLIIK
ncbi:hypothetical protein [Candidatus Galacturonibacter soehngenii]|uniref:Uncharacterized protein n=1 Tax=Candidatus Galacturonatibacter soehngenii TaxID=2307010 RepID=A0A7V7QJ59_9FIRM|nr:hypothetical protein [Candidatus Galacturonibacter soehngenii]KAB1437575.1 hypothetical protein F7O84_08185 [Candidatus Galacturonibacter soehngenii]